jgi:hypothetical protein
MCSLVKQRYTELVIIGNSTLVNKIAHNNQKLKKKGIELVRELRLVA